MSEKGTHQSPPPKLDKPGAGLPLVESLMARFWVLPHYSKKSSWEECNELFLKHGDKISSQIEGLPLSKLEEKVLIPRLPGLEDSSRYWSIQQTLEHILIVSQGMGEIIVDLTEGRKPPYLVDVAQVKPQNKLPLQTGRDLYRKGIRDVYDRLKRIPEQKRQSKTAHYHPWFGKIKAFEWNWLVASHHLIHRKQIEEIHRRLTETA